MRHAHLQPLAARGAAVGARHVGLGPGLIEEHQAGRIQVCPGAGPRLAALVHVRTVLFARMTGLLLARHPVPDQEPVQRAEPEAQAMPGQRPAQFLDRQVGLVGLLLPASQMNHIINTLGIPPAIHSGRITL